MSHIVLTPVIRKGSKTSKRQMSADVNECGGLHHTGRYEGAVVAVSKLPWCERVVATHVTETYAGTWRNGVKS